jgi:hypothetical protein
MNRDKELLVNAIQRSRKEYGDLPRHLVEEFINLVLDAGIEAVYKTTPYRQSPTGSKYDLLNRGNAVQSLKDLRG